MFVICTETEHEGLRALLAVWLRLIANNTYVTCVMKESEGSASGMVSTDGSFSVIRGSLLQGQYDDDRTVLSVRFMYGSLSLNLIKMVPVGNAAAIRLSGLGGFDPPQQQFVFSGWGG